VCDFTSTNNNDFIYTPIAPPAPETNFYEIKPALLNLVMKDGDIIKLKLFSFSLRGRAKDDVAAHLNNFVDLCEMQKYKDVDGDIIKLNADLLPPVVAMHACIVLGLHEHDIYTACDVESRR
jgi:hypothetical protein